MEATGQLRGGHHSLRFRALIGGVAGRVVTDPRTMMNVLAQNKFHPDPAGRCRPPRRHGEDPGHPRSRNQATGRQRLKGENRAPAILPNRWVLLHRRTA